MKAYKLFTPDEAKAIREAITDWKPGNAEDWVGKRNEEATCPDQIAERIWSSTIIPAHFVESITPPKFNRYRDGGEYPSHCDGAVQFGIRSDLACTLFLSDDYEGGELVIDGIEAKLPAGHALVYECWRPHKVNPVTKGERIAAIFWMQSYIRSQEQRDLLTMLRGVIIETEGEQRARLGAVHEKLVKMWWS